MMAARAPPPADWRPINTSPRDGTRFLAWARMVADEIDEDDTVLRRDVVEHYAVVAYWFLGCMVEFPYRGSVPTNITYTHWQPLPEGPKS